MDLNEIKSLIAEKTGIPVEMLTGETPEECIALAKAILSYKKDNEQKPDTIEQSFADFAAKTFGRKSPEFAALEEIENMVAMQKAYKLKANMGFMSEDDKKEFDFGQMAKKLFNR